MFRRARQAIHRGSRQSWRLGLAASILLVLFLGSGACTRLLSDEGLTGGTLDAGSDAGLDAEDADASQDVDADIVNEAGEDVAVDGDGATASCDPCSSPDLVRMPCRPEVQDSPSGEPIVYAVRSMRLGMSKGDADDWENLGLDRDCMNTTALGEPTPCILPKPENGKDGLGGRDNSMGRNYGQLVRFMMNTGIIKSDIEVALNGDLERGFDGWTITLDDFNHTADDPQVTVIVRLSEGTTNETGEPEEALWDGADRWSVDPNSLSTTGDPLYLDDNAFVVDGKLVASMPAGVPFEVQADQGTLEFFLNELAMVAELSEDFMRVEQGAISGVWPLAVAIDQVTEFAMRFGLCPPNALLTTMLNSVGDGADIRTNLVPAPASACNGISFGMAFLAESAQLGPVAPPKPELPDLCADAGAGDAGTEDAADGDAGLDDAGDSD